MLDDVKKYFETIEKAEEEKTKAFADADVEWETERDDELHTATRELARARRRLAVRGAQKELENSADPLVSWIARNTLGDYQDHAHEILRALPVDSLEPLEELAKERGWCSTWDDFVSMAGEVGVLPGQTPVSAERQALMRWFRDRFTNNRRTLDDLRVKLDALITAEVAAAVAEIEKAKAEQSAAE